MGRRTGGGGRKPPPPFLSPYSSFSKRSRFVCRIPSLPKPPLAPPVAPFVGTRKKKVQARLWMRLDRRGGCEIFMCDKAFVAERSGVHARDLRVVGPLLSRSPSILARENAMVINLGFIRAIVTADEVLVLEPLAQEVLPFIDKLRRHAETGSECELPFEFQVLDLALEAVCFSFNSSVADLNRHATVVLEDLTRNVSTRNLDRVRSLKSNLTSLLADVHKVRYEVEHILDDNENVAQLHLSRKLTKAQHQEALLASAASSIMFPLETRMVPPNSVIKRSVGVATSAALDNDVGNLEMLLEAYFMQLDGICNRIVLVQGYIIDTEDYLNIHLDNQRNELIRFRLTLIIASFGIAINTLIAASFGMNMPHNGDGNTAVGSFWPFVGATSSFCLLITIMLFGYAWRNKLLGS